MGDTPLILIQAEKVEQLVVEFIGIFRTVGKDGEELHPLVNLCSGLERAMLISEVRRLLWSGLGVDGLRQSKACCVLPSKPHSVAVSVGTCEALSGHFSICSMRRHKKFNVHK